MQDKLRDRMAVYLAAHSIGILSTAAAQGAWAMPVRYHPLPAAPGNHGLAVACLIPRWADVAYCLERDPRVLLVLPDLRGLGDLEGLCWLQISGVAEAVAAPDWPALLPGWASTTPPDDLYLALHVTPQRVDLFDESRGWGARETVEV